MKQHNIQHSRVEQHYKVRSEDLNGYGILHGGRLLTLCDEIAYLSASRHAGCDCLTRAVHRARFHAAVMPDETIIITAATGLTGNSSIWVQVDVYNSKREAVMDGVFVFAAINSHKKPVRVVSVIAESEDDQQLQRNLQQLKDKL